MPTVERRETMGRIRADVLERLCWCAEIALLEVETLEEWEIWLRLVRNLEELFALYAERERLERCWGRGRCNGAA
jgi:hypothetical protein